MKKHLNKIIFALGVWGVVNGISRGEALVVLQKAINICLECIGIG